MELSKTLTCITACFLVAATNALASTVTETWPAPEEIDHFIDEMKTRHGFDTDALSALFATVKPSAFVLKTIAPPTDPGVRSWQRYRSRFLDRARIENGVRFWNSHTETLARAEDTFGVPPEIVVAIIGVETEYGRNKGNISVLEALSTIAFAYPPRRDFFRSELEQFLLLTRENRQAPEAIRGSYAGAIGIPQFMPGSQRRFAVDFDEDGRVDLMNSPQDAIGSVARFLKLHGWEKGQAITERVRTPLAEPEKLVATGILPKLDQTALRSAGVSDDAIPSRYPAALVDLVTPDEATEYWWGFNNFYAITRYNRSSFYAMSVAQLAEAIKARRLDPRPLKTPVVKKTRAGYRAKRHRAE